MKIKVLGCSGAEMPDSHLPAFLIDESILLDAGTITSALNESAQRKITHILITHTHLDHIRGIPFLADNMLLRNRRHQITLVGTKKVLDALKNSIFNNSIWPDFTNIPSPENPVLRLKIIERGKCHRVNGYSIVAEDIDHSVAGAGYIIKNPEDKRLVYTGDTGPTTNLWKRVNIEAKTTGVDGAIIEVTFPNNMRELALRTGHLTPEMLFQELKKLKHLPERIFITHSKPQFSDIITRELRGLKIKQLIILKEGRSYVI